MKYCFNTSKHGGRRYIRGKVNYWNGVPMCKSCYNNHRHGKFHVHKDTKGNKIRYTFSYNWWLGGYVCPFCGKK